MKRTTANIPRGFVGVFDSGSGGLAVLTALRRELPGENFGYVFDRTHSPYGNRSAKYVTKRAIKIVEFLAARGAKAIVVACNTATSVAIDELRARFDLPVIGVEPPIKPAATTVSGEIVVLVTPRTSREQRFLRLVQAFPTAKITVAPCPDLAAAVERNFHDLNAVIPLLREIFAALPKPQAVVLGCTHYYFLRPQLRAVLGESVKIFDGADGAARQTRATLARLGAMSPPSLGKTAYFYL